MTQFSDDDIKAVANAIHLACIEQGTWSYQAYARSAIAALTELGWGKKPTRSELNDLLLSQYDQTALPFSHPAVSRSIQQLLDAGFAVDGPESEWEPTEEAFDALFRMWKGGAGTIIDYIPAVLKHLHDKPHLIGMKGE